MSSDEKAKQFHREGDAYYNHSHKFSEALNSFNKSLCFAESEEIKALAYASRAEVYFEARKFQKCLENIQLARDHDKTLTKLDRLETKCRNLLESCQPAFKDDPWNFFKLSHPANNKIPFIADCLKFKKDSKYGRHIVTNQDLKPGDIVAIEDPFFKHLDKTHCYNRCRNCLKANMLSLIPCPGHCADTMFCSNECLNEANKIHIKYECGKKNQSKDVSTFNHLIAVLLRVAGNFKELHDLMRKSEKVTIFDFDMTNPDELQTKKNQLKAFFSLMTKKQNGNDKDLETFVQRDLKKLWRTKEEFEVIKRIVEIYQVNASSFSPSMFIEDLKLNSSNEVMGSTISLFGSMINHSCDPNVSLMSVDNKKVAVVQWPIKAGKQLFFCYRFPFFEQPSRSERRLELFKGYQFKCKCWACSKNFVVTQELAEEIDSKYNISSSAETSTIDVFRMNCKKIEERFKKHPCSDTIVCFKINTDCLRVISCFGYLNELNKLRSE